jgi:hypothetical protein
VVLLIGPIINSPLVDDYPRWLEEAYAIVREIVEGAIKVARFRGSELQQLDDNLHAISQVQIGVRTGCLMVVRYQEDTEMEDTE